MIFRVFYIWRAAKKYVLLQHNPTPDTMAKQMLLFSIEECFHKAEKTTKSKVASEKSATASSKVVADCKRFIGAYLAKPSEWQHVIAYMQAFVVPYEDKGRQPATGQYIDCVERIPNIDKKNKPYIDFLKNYAPSVDDLHPTDVVTLQGRSVLEWHTFLGNVHYAESEFFQGLLEAYRLDWKKLLHKQTYDVAISLVKELEIPETVAAVEGESQSTIDALQQQIEAQAEELKRLREELRTRQAMVEELQRELESVPTVKTALSPKGKLALIATIMGELYYRAGSCSFKEGIGNTNMGAIPQLVAVLSGHSEVALRRYPPFGDRNDVREHKRLKKEDKEIIDKILYDLGLEHLVVMMPQQVQEYYQAKRNATM